ncbi:MAG TPA: hypothetical protein VGS19_35830 [Streptosporangiaceae bacterium]|nr:hypothetical protein [Streptosporangiaceae bacterium]
MRLGGHGGVRRAASGVVSGAVVAVLAAGGMVWYSAAPAWAVSGRAGASCAAAHQNVEANDGTWPAYGNQGMIATNNQGTLNGTHARVFRSLFIWDAPGNDVEVGWGTGGSPMNEPTLYAEWVKDGVDSLPQWAGTIGAGANWHFEVDNAHGIGIWRFYFDGGTSPFKYSPTMPFNSGWPVANSEHYNTCDTLWTHFYGLQDATSLGHYRPWISLQCWADTAPGWNIQPVSSSEMYVQTSGHVC